MSRRADMIRFRLLFCHLSTDLFRFLLGVDESNVSDDDVEVAVALAVHIGPELATVEVRHDREEGLEMEGEHVD